MTAENGSTSQLFDISYRPTYLVLDAINAFDLIGQRQCDEGMNTAGMVSSIKIHLIGPLAKMLI